MKQVIRQSIAFQVQANHKIPQAQEEKVPVANRYRAEPNHELESEIDNHFAEAMAQVTSPFDSHPAPQERSPGSRA